jgi:hypothetical protein
MDGFQTSAPRIIYPDLSRFVPNIDEVEEWQIRKLAKTRVTQMSEISSVHQERLQEFNAAATPIPIEFDECVSGSDIRIDNIDPELLQRILQITETPDSPERVPMEPPAQEPEHCE